MKPTINELTKILENHKLWLKTYGEDGERAVLSRADLSGANLSGADLSYANLRDADLSYANLRDANLSRANLRDANLSRADLSYADLSDANLSGADLSYADLSDANLSGADLSGANLSRADLSDADLSDADLDFSALPLWCGSLSAKFDEKHYIQFLYHILKSLQRNDLIDVKIKNQFLTKRNIDIANKFHRAEECGKINKENGK